MISEDAGESGFWGRPSDHNLYTHIDETLMKNDLNWRFKSGAWRKQDRLESFGPGESRQVSVPCVFGICPLLEWLRRCLLFPSPSNTPQGKNITLPHLPSYSVPVPSPPLPPPLPLSILPYQPPNPIAGACHSHNVNIMHVSIPCRSVSSHVLVRTYSSHYSVKSCVLVCSHVSFLEASVSIGLHFLRGSQRYSIWPMHTVCLVYTAWTHLRVYELNKWAGGDGVYYSSQGLKASLLESKSRQI